MKRIFATFGAAAAVVFLLNGCQTFTEPEVDYLGSSYSERQKTNADQLLASISELSLADAQEIAIANNPSYTSAYYAIDAARMRYYQALGAYSPVVTAGFDMGNNHVRYYNRHNANQPDRSRTFTTSTSIGASWLLFDGLAREFAWKIAEHDLENQTRLTEDDCRLLIRAVALAYNDILLAKENVRIAEEDMDFQEKSLADTIIKLEAGAVAKSSKLNFQILSNVAAGNKVVAEAQYENALYALAVLMGYPEGTLPPHVTFPAIKSNFVDDLPAVDIYLDNALNYRPDLKAYREQLKMAEYELYRTYSAYSPSIYANMDFSFNTNSGRTWNDGYGSSNSYYNQPVFSYGLSANWTIFNGLIRYNTNREYRARLAAAKYTVADLWLTVVQEVRGAHNNYLQSVKQARIYEKTLEYTTEQRKLVEEEYRLGGAELTRLNEAQRDLVDAQTTLASAYINVQNALAQLEASAAINVARYNTAPKVFPQPEGEKPEVPPVPGSPESIHSSSPTTVTDEVNEEKRSKPADNSESPAAAAESTAPVQRQGTATDPDTGAATSAPTGAATIAAPAAYDSNLSPAEQQLLRAAQQAAEKAEKDAAAGN